MNPFELFSVRLTGLAAIAALGFAGCSTVATVHGLSDLPNLPATATGVAIPVSLQASSDPVISTSGCSLIAIRGGGIKTFEIETPPGSDVFFAELPDGVYAFKEIVCSHLHWDLTFQNWPHFQVFAGKVSVIGGVSLYLSDAHSMTARLSSRERNRTETLRLIGRASAETRERLYSGYTGKQIVAAELEKPAQYSHWQVEPPLKGDERAWPSFHACYRGEGDVNGLWLGQLNVDAIYENGQFVGAEPKGGWNTFSDQFAKCANDTLKDFHPRAQAHIRYKLYL